MFFLLRMTFWLTVVCVLLPNGGDKTAPEAQIDATQAATLAGAAVSDMRGFCDRQPDACVVGGKVAVALGHKAEAGARTLYQFISARLSEKPAAGEKPAPAEKTVAKAVPAAPVNHGTLSAADLTPAWHAPVPLPPRREARTSRPAA